MNIDEIKARAKDAKNDVDGHDAENMTYHYYHDVTALIAEVERLQQQLNAAVEDVPHKCLYCAKRLGWKTCKDASYISDGEVCLNFEYLGVERSE